MVIKFIKTFGALTLLSSIVAFGKADTPSSTLKLAVVDIQAAILQTDEGKKAKANLEKDVELISAIAIAQAKTNPNIKNAVIVDNTENGMALSAFYKFLADETDWEIELFHNEQDARQWLE